MCHHIHFQRSNVNRNIVFPFPRYWKHSSLYKQKNMSTMCLYRYSVKPAHEVNSIKYSPFSYPAIDYFIWIEPLLRGHLCYNGSFSCQNGDLLIQLDCISYTSCNQVRTNYTVKKSLIPDYMCIILSTRKNISHFTECDRFFLFEPQYYKINICCFSAKNASFRRKNKNWLARNQDSVSECGDMSIRGLLFQWDSTIKIQLSVLV